MQRRNKKTGLLVQLEAFLNLAGKEEIGIGTFAEVFKVYDKRDHTHKALRQLEKSKQTAEEIEQEKQINQKLMKINHPNILKVFEIFEDEELICYLTEYCEGGSLWDTLNLIKGKRFSELEAVTIVLETAKAVEILHNNGICHRDLKPENILFVQEFQHNKPFQIKLADFGLSTNKMLMETIAGTKQYIAPQQIRKDKYTKAVDIWALGIILDELIHGVPFFTGENHQEAFQMIVNKDFRVRSQAVSQDTRTLLLRMARRYPSQRPKVEEVIEKLEAIKDQLTVLPVLPTHRSEKGSARKQSEDIVNLYTEGDFTDYYCPKHPDEVSLRKRKTKQTSCSKCIEEDANIVPIEEYIKILQQQNRKKQQQILRQPQFPSLSPYSLSGFGKNDKINKQLDQRRTFLLQRFTKMKSRYSFLNFQKVGDEHVELLEKCVDELKQLCDEFSKTYANYTDLVMATFESRIQKFLDNYFKEI